jgi:hypothetical protein
MTVGNASRPILTIKAATAILYQRTSALNSETYKTTNIKKKTSDKQ